MGRIDRGAAGTVLDGKEAGGIDVKTVTNQIGQRYFCKRQAHSCRSFVARQW